MTMFNNIKVNGGDPVDSTTTPDHGKHKLIPSKTLDATDTLTITGDGAAPKDPVRCTLSRIQNTNLPLETRTMTHFGMADTNGAWTVIFYIDPGATYLLSCCHAIKDGIAHYVEVIVNPAKEGKFKPKNRLTINSNPAPTFAGGSITASGTVANAADTVTCTLTPINGDGTTRTMGAGAFSPQTLPATMGPTMMGVTPWAVVFIPPPATPPAPPNQFSLLYQLEAAAPNEGSDCVEGNV